MVNSTSLVESSTSLIYTSLYGEILLGFYTDAPKTEIGIGVRSCTQLLRFVCVRYYGFIKFYLRFERLDIFKK